ncbi:xanthine dehydrogenase family protein molybdopterin-binding subunit [Bosea sp. (in: a-proteobacteria)]|uniref:xanthine dehydrogenase family protein molybdopterin-binding subunit n=1 Tax=Bosea sp. (in: a-proteobacteria) TaxID=1871050 RepID=UPI002B460EC6|nr:xanthine dehydrogenase family protein molybdopterin-binding subunit [Bosea sp. (in: a-proteobacteria)]WRH60107.1 MAG: xanthine dehydrogenase family protein molybdopterin-binding subunit [Bosea sp. (in: a-proteobacteria)]
MLKNDTHVGSPRSRVDGPAKVTGQATYAAEFTAPDLAHAYVVGSSIARGKITGIDATAAEAVPGVIKVFTHENRPGTAWFSYKYQDMVGPPGDPFRPLASDEVQFSDQPVALVVAESFDVARHAASLVRVSYEQHPHETDLSRARHDSYEPPKKRMGIAPPPKPRGDAVKAFGEAPVRVSGEYTIATEHHNPMEPHATTVIWDGGGKITVHDKTQGVQNSQAYVASVFGLSSDEVRVVSPYVGGGFGSGLRPQHQLFLAVMASLALERSVRLELTRQQMFSHVHRPETINVLSLGADHDGKLRSIQHQAVAATSHFEDHQEVVVNWSGLLYPAENVDLRYELAKLDTYSPGDMRAPGAPLGVFALESAMDELAIATGVDPVELRLRNYAERDENDDLPFSSKELRACYRQGAEKFGWSHRNPKPGSMREGRELIGWGMASGVWEANMMKTSARAVLGADGRLAISCATSDIGTGTYTILTQIAADALGLAMDDVTVELGDSSLPTSPVQGGSWTAASAGSAVMAACQTLRETLLKQAAKIDGSPLANAAIDDVAFSDGRIVMRTDAARSVQLADAVSAGGHDKIEAEESAGPGLIGMMMPKSHSSYTHAAVFVEVRIDEDLGVVRVTRVVNAVAAGRILNPKTARSQIIGGVVWGIGMAMHEETLTDHRLGRIMNHSLSEYHVPANADIHDIDVIFVEEHDDKTSPIGVKGLGEIGIVGTAAAIANAVHHATGKRIRSLPITIDKILAG